MFDGNSININGVTLEFEEIINELEALSNPEDIEGMASFGITPKRTMQ